MLHPKYIHGRFSEIRKNFRTRVLLCHVDLDDSNSALESVTKIAFINDWTLICVFSTREGARYIENLKSLESAPPDILKERKPGTGDLKAQFAFCFSRIKGINKTDIATIANTFGSLRAVINATMEELALCPGLGEKKVRRIYDAFRKDVVPKRKEMNDDEEERENEMRTSSEIDSKEGEDGDE